MFGPLNIVGAMATCDIPSNKVVVCIPNRLLINKQRILNGELRDLINTNYSLFDEKLYPSNEFNIFVVFLIYEKLKGKSSFFFPYIQIIQENPYTMLDWCQ